MIAIIDGFWLPKNIRAQLLNSESEFNELSFTGGRECLPETPGSVSARWPKLTPYKWRKLLELLSTNRKNVPVGKSYWDRLQRAIKIVGDRLSDPNDSLNLQAVSTLPAYTGYSLAMIQFTLNTLELINLTDMPKAFNLNPTWRCAHQWEPLSELPGFLHFYPKKIWNRYTSKLPGRTQEALFKPAPPLNFVTGFGAGNVPGTALLIALLAQATTLDSNPPPVTVIKNSRREPIFSPLVLSALEEVDPDLVASIAILVWDYEESAVQKLLLPETDLVIAAASDQSIAEIHGQLLAAQSSKAARFHAHGHKVSFSAISQQVLERGLADPDNGTPLLDIVALLAGLDSIFWDQHGCLSSRIHFVESGTRNIYSVLDYTQRLSAQLSILATHLPRGNWPRQHLHERFDHYKTLEMTGKLQVCSAYDDEYLIILDQRELDPQEFYRQINDCQGRVVVVRPVSDLMEIPRHYLRHLPANNLQSISVALGTPGMPLSKRELNFFHACGSCGLTAIRSVGRGAFPQLAYSWDGLMPLDLTRSRPAGHFTTIEFNNPYQQILETYQLLAARGSGLSGNS